jgi:hypothetical protein
MDYDPEIEEDYGIETAQVKEMLQIRKPRESTYNLNINCHQQIGH